MVKKLITLFRIEDYQMPVVFTAFVLVMTLLKQTQVLIPNMDVVILAHFNLLAGILTSNLIKLHDTTISRKPLASVIDTLIMVLSFCIIFTSLYLLREVLK